MKLTVQCLECFNKTSTIPFAQVPANLEQRVSNVKNFTGYEVELSEDFTYELSCSEGHEQITILKTPRFEILMQISLNAILDGYYREAVASSASALERFYEYYLNVRSIDNGTDALVFKQTWKKNLESRSERQMGAYLIAHTFIEGEQPQTLETVENINERRPSKFRNDVIHKGYMPTREEAIKFGNRVISLIYPILKQLRKTSLSKVEEFEGIIYEEKLLKAKEKRNNRPITWCRHHFVFGPNHKINTDQPNIDDLLLQLDTFRRPLRTINQIALNNQGCSVLSRDSV